ncbi:histidine kinase [Aliibacillus thermotolerans]|uniref:Histidine kinase n=1 Tax=Aliibacillus thermotolerans TaxID=1834418 RepID=A0ABW0U897_9BACI|nr:histidine kinase [Aliibacillus thermotolerans]MDA3131078.1 histidine kinase [Aliibacillus thermotolerans]
MKKPEERILVCVYYGPNGERLIRRGGKLASLLNCPFWILTVDPSPKDELDIEKSNYIETWGELAEKYGAEDFIIKYNEKRPAAKVIGEVAKEKHITQVIIGQTAQSRWREITKGSFINLLLHELPFIDLHIVSVSRQLKKEEGEYERGVRSYLVKEEDTFKLSFNHTDEVIYEGIFFKEVGTDFNNGIFKLMKNNRLIHLDIVDDEVTDAHKLDQ